MKQSVMCSLWRAKAAISMQRPVSLGLGCVKYRGSRWHLLPKISEVMDAVARVLVSA